MHIKSGGGSSGGGGGVTRMAIKRIVRGIIWIFILTNGIPYGKWTLFLPHFDSQKSFAFPSSQTALYHQFGI